MKNNIYLDPVPSLGHKYFAFNDGKVRPSRTVVIKITNVFDKKTMVGSNIYDLWKEESEDCDFLYSLETDYFIYGEDVENPENTYIFARTNDGGWFSFNQGFGDVSLDTTGRQFNVMKTWVNNFTEEAIERMKELEELCADG